MVNVDDIPEIPTESAKKRWIPSKEALGIGKEDARVPFLVFIACFAAYNVQFLIRAGDGQALNDMASFIRSSVLNADFGSQHATFLSSKSASDMMEWLRGPFLSTFFASSSVPSGSESNLFDSFNYFELGGPLIRVVRAKNALSPFSTDNEDTSACGINAASQPYADQFFEPERSLPHVPLFLIENVVSSRRPLATTRRPRTPSPVSCHSSPSQTTKPLLSTAQQPQATFPQPHPSLQTPMSASSSSSFQR
jgi:hypothetical protein